MGDGEELPRFKNVFELVAHEASQKVGPLTHPKVKGLGVHHHRVGGDECINGVSITRSQGASICGLPISEPRDQGFRANCARLLAEERLRTGWTEELATMVARMKSLRALLGQSLAAQGRASEAAAVEVGFRAAWARADTQLDASRL